MSRKGFTDYDDEQLVEFVKNYQFLYDREHKDYTNLNTRIKAWNKISKAIGKDANQCKKRWRDIRDNYYKAIRKGKYVPTNPEEPTTSKKWTLFDRLEFLNSLYRERSSFCNISKRNYHSPQREMDDGSPEHITHNKNDEDHVDVFMKSIAMSVKKLPPHLITRAKIEILTTVSRLEEQVSHVTI